MRRSRDWFAVERLDADTFAIREPRHWEETNCTLLTGARRAVLMDTGLGAAGIRAVADRLTALPVEVLTTHAHWDYIGGHGLFDRFAASAAEERVSPFRSRRSSAASCASPAAFPGTFAPRPTPSSGAPRSGCLPTARALTWAAGSCA